MTRTASLNGIRATLFVCMPLVALLSNLYVLATSAFIRFEYGKSGFPASEIYDSAERFSLATATLRYLRSGESSEQLAALSLQGRAVYNAREVRHLIDVKFVMRGAFLVHGACLVLVALTIALAWRVGQQTLALRAIYQGCQALLIAIAAIGMLAYFNFDLFFTIFHQILFSGDSWLFAFSDTLIQLFPVPFWVDASLALVLSAIGESLLVGGACYVFARRRGN